MNRYWHNKSSRLKHLFKVQTLSPGKVGVPMTGVKEVWSSARNAHTPKEKLLGYKGFLRFGSQNEVFQNVWTPLLNVARLKMEKLGHITQGHTLSGNSVARN